VEEAALCCQQSVKPPSSGMGRRRFCEAGRCHPLPEHGIWTRKHRGEMSILTTADGKLLLLSIGKQLGLWKEIILSNIREEIKNRAFSPFNSYFSFFNKVIINMYKESQRIKFLLQKREATSNHKQEPSGTRIISEQMLCSCFGEGRNLHSNSARVHIRIARHQ